MSQSNGNTSLSDELPLTIEQSAIPSSPPRMLSNDQEARRERRKPSITPRKFNRFFTPRSHGSTRLSSARQALQDITGGSANSRHTSQSSPSRPFRNTSSLEGTPSSFTRDLKRRKLYHTPESSAEQLNETKRKDVAFMVHDVEPRLGSDGNIQSSPCERAFRNVEDVHEEDAAQEPIRPIKQTSHDGLAAQILQMSIGSSTRTSRQHFAYPVNGMSDHKL